MSAKTKPYDMSAPGTKALLDEIVHGTFIKEGTMVAFPTCFPGVTVPIPADESRITALGVTGDGIVYGGTSGRRSHVFVGMFHGLTGLVFDLATLEEANHCAAVCCLRDKYLVCVNGPDGGRVVGGDYQGLPFDLIQEWGFTRPTLRDVGAIKGERILHAACDATGGSMIGVTADHLFTMSAADAKLEIVAEVQGAGRIAAGSQGGIFGLDKPGHLWRYDPVARKLERRAVNLPKGDWDLDLMWARGPQDGHLYTADARGTLFSFDEKGGFSPALGQTPLAPVGPMAVTHDGRLFGFCGPELSKMFCYDPSRKEISNLGVAASILERRRYGYTFGDAVVGRDGQIIFGEDDQLGHLWLYFPSIQPRHATT